MRATPIPFRYSFVEEVNEKMQKNDRILMRNIATTFENNKKLPKAKFVPNSRLLDIEGRKYNKWGNAKSNNTYEGKIPFNNRGRISPYSF